MAAKKKTEEKTLRAALPKNEQGLVEWRKIVSPQNILLNRKAFAAKGIDADALSEEEVDEYRAAAKDEELLISLMGLRELADKRGVKSVNTVLESHDKDWTIARCSVEFLPNEEEPEGITYSDLGDCHIQNVSPDFATRMGALAANCAFSRAVRAYFRIKAIGFEEINPFEKVEIAATDGRPNGLLQKKLADKGIDFASFKALVEADGRYTWKDNWTRIEDITHGPTVFSFVELLGK